MNDLALPAGYTFGPMTDEEVQTLRGWAIAEGWNPGIADIGIARAYDPDAFIALRRGRELVGGGSIFSYQGRYGFMGLFIMRADMRGQGLGAILWHERLRLMRARLAPRASIGMDGVLEMKAFYARGGFEFVADDIRYEGIATGQKSPQCSALADIDQRQLHALDRECFACDRHEFLSLWLQAPGLRTAAITRDGHLEGFGVLRPAVDGFKFGPVLARHPADARILVADLMSGVEGQRIQLDVPAANPEAMALAESFDLTQVFRCARMYHGGVPELNIGQVFGLTSFEFG